MSMNGRVTITPEHHNNEHEHEHGTYKHILAGQHTIIVVIVVTSTYILLLLYNNDTNVHEFMGHEQGVIIT